MHNIIQELRGNVRVFARIRPFIPDDGKPDDEGEASLSHESETVVSVVSSEASCENISFCQVN